MPLSDLCVQAIAKVLVPDDEVSTSQYELRGAAKQLHDHCQDYSEVIISGPADTGKTLACCLLIDKLARRYAGCQIVIVRKRRTDMTASVLQTYQRRVLRFSNDVRVLGGSSPAWFDYPNGSRVWVAGLDKESKVLSAEYDVAYVNQAEELAVQEWETLGTRVTGRAGHMPWGLLLGDCNPSGKNHWILQRHKQNKLVLLESSHKDNPELFDAKGRITEAGKRRLSKLKGLSGARLARLYHGLWANPEGAIYDVFDDAKHKIKGFFPPLTWPRVVGVDPLGAYTAAVWIAYNPEDGILHVYREYYQPFGVTTEGHARACLEISRRAGETVFAWVGGGPSERQARLDWSMAGVPLLELDNKSVWSQIDKVYNLLKEFKLVIHDNCEQLLSEIGEYRRKLKDGEATDEIEDKEKYHMLDALRYAIGWLSEPVERSEVVYNPIRIGEY